METNTPAAQRLVWTAVVVLAVLHHDFWWWNDRTLVLGFLPIGLAYHALYSVAAGCVWALANKYAWPHHIEEWASEFDGTANKTSATKGTH